MLLKNLFKRFLKNSKTISSLIFKNSLPQYSTDIKIQGVLINNYVEKIQKEYNNAHCESNNFTSSDTKNKLTNIISLLKERDYILKNINNLEELLNDNNNELKKLAEEELKEYNNKITIIDESLLDAIVTFEDNDLYNSAILEVNMGVGGQEAMLFAKEMFDMYCNFIDYKGWELIIDNYQPSDLGGIRHASATINGSLVFHYLKHEAGVHRVQRVPKTEKYGKIHTSTISVIVLPKPDNFQIKLDDKDLRIETKRASGAGGQHVNTTDSAVRIVHLPTGLNVECQTERSQIKNKEIALIKLKNLLYKKEIENQMNASDTIRKSQVRSNFRNEKIRTYNFPQDRITDHRLQVNFHDIKGFLRGQEALENMIKNLDSNYKIQLLSHIVNK